MLVIYLYSNALASKGIIVYIFQVLLFLHEWYTCIDLPVLFLSASDFDIIDEAIYFFKANIFFRNYEIKVSNLIYTAADLSATSSGFKSQ